MKKPIRIAVLVIFISMFTVHVAVFPNIEVGLDQKLSMPEDSYVLKYFQVIHVETIQLITKVILFLLKKKKTTILPLFVFLCFLIFKYMEDLLSMGPPVYFVVTEGLNYSNTDVQNIICGGQRCNVDSLYTQIYSAANQPSMLAIAFIRSFDFISSKRIENLLFYFVPDRIYRKLPPRG